MATFIKWVGGKTQLLEEIIPLIPKKITTYFELFAGGGSVFIQLLNLCENKRVIIENFIINDINTNLVNIYKCIKDDYKTLLIELKIICNLYEKLPLLEYGKRENIILPIDISKVTDKKMFYYYIRKKYNEIKNSNEIYKTSAYFIFLNKTGFRGLYRENSMGEFNVPYGNYKNPKIYNEENIKKLNYLFNKYKVLFLNKNFTDIEFTNNVICNKIINNTFVYLDPPYFPINDTSFTNYSVNGFKEKNHEELIHLLNNLNNNNIKFLMSNSYTEWILNNTKKFNNKQLIAKRTINSKIPNSLEFEILVFNF